MERHKGRSGIAHLVSAARYTLDGFKGCYKTEVAFRQEILLGVIHVSALAALPLSVWVRLYLLSIWLLLFSVELINSAIEAVVDLASPEHHALAKKAKDCGSAAVFCVLVIIVGSWTVVLFDLFRKLGG